MEPRPLSAPKPPAPPKDEARAKREARLAEALRENLRRRKAAAPVKQKLDSRKPPTT